MENKYDYIIVGQGLAGTTLAHLFLQQRKRVLVIDEVKEITSSKVAAGMWNPIVFKRYTQSFLAKKLLAFNAEFYPKIEQVLAANFYQPRPYFKIFPSEQDIEHWRGKLTNPEVRDFLNPEIHLGLDAQYYNSPLGAAPIKHCGFLDVKEYINSSATYFAQQNGFINERFDFDALSLEDEVRYKEFTAKKIFFCEGMGALDNPYWKDIVTFYPVKGELLTIKANLPEKEAIINKGIFMVPIGSNLYNVGSTYNWSDIDYEPTENAKTLLIDKIKNIIKVPFEVVTHKAAIRPSAKDRRPYVGLHKHHQQIGIFNGLGSKGVMLAPFFANQLVEHILEDKELHPEVDVARCFKK